MTNKPAQQQVLAAEVKRVVPHATPLASVIESLRTDLKNISEQADKTRQPRFKVEEAVIELTIKIEEDSTYTGGVRAWVLSAGTSASEKL